MPIRIEDIDETPVKPVKAPESVVVKTDNYFPIDGLPSRGKFYPVGTVIEARPLKVLEVKLLASLNEKNFNTVVNEVLARTVKGVSVEQLLVADKYYIIFWLRSNTYKDSSYTMKFDCPKCKKESEYNFGLDCLHVNELDDAVDLNKELELPQSKSKLTFRLPVVDDERKLESFSVKYSTGGRTVDQEVLAVANVVSTVDGSSLSLMQKYEFLIDVPPGDYAYVESYVESFDIGIDSEMMVTCNKCGGNSPVGITFQKEFFLPKFNFTRHTGDGAPNL